MGPVRLTEGLNRFLAQGLSPGALIELDPTEAHHLSRVLRLGPGAQILLLNGQGQEYLGTVERIRRRAVYVKVHILVREEPPPDKDLILGLPLLKKEHSLFLAEKAVELGITKLIPFTSSRTVAKAGPYFEARLRTRALQALKQCRRLWSPQILPPKNLEDLKIAAALKVFAYEKAPEKTLKEVLKSFNGSSLALLSGPEGGFSKEEATFLQEKGFIPVSLGPYILRAETASFYLMSQAHAWAYL